MRSIAFGIALITMVSMLTLGGAFAEDSKWEDEYGAYDASSAGLTGEFQYEMFEGTATIILPPEYPLHHTFAGKEKGEWSTWSIEARTSGEDWDNLMVISGPGSIQEEIDELLEYNLENNIPIEGRYIETTSGYRAWIGDWSGYDPNTGFSLENSHTAFIDYTDGRHLQVSSSEMSNEAFEELVNSIKVDL